MASNKRTIHLGLDYSQFTGGVTEVNRKMSLLDAEFKRATQEAKNYGSASDQLALKQEYLTQKIALQNQKVEEAKKAYDALSATDKALITNASVLDEKIADLNVIYGKDVDFNLTYKENVGVEEEETPTDPGENEEPNEGVKPWVIVLIVVGSVLVLAGGAAAAVILIKKKRTTECTEEENI